MANIIQKIKSTLLPKSAKFSAASNLLYNRGVLYFFLLVSILDLYYLSVTHDYLSVAIFIITGVLVSFFNKNMIVIMVIALATMHLLKFGIKSTINEGMRDAGSSAGANLDKEGKASEEEAEEEEDGLPLKKKDSSAVDDLEAKRNNLKEINSEMAEFDTLQKKILKGLNDITPLMDKAETFIEKLENKYPAK